MIHHFVNYATTFRARRVAFSIAITCPAVIAPQAWINESINNECLAVLFFGQVISRVVLIANSSCYIVWLGWILKIVLVSGIYEYFRAYFRVLNCLKFVTWTNFLKIYHKITSKTLFKYRTYHFSSLVFPYYSNFKEREKWTRERRIRAFSSVIAGWNVMDRIPKERNVWITHCGMSYRNVLQIWARINRDGHFSGADYFVAAANISIIRVARLRADIYLWVESCMSDFGAGINWKMSDDVQK